MSNITKEKLKEVLLSIDEQTIYEIYKNMFVSKEDVVSDILKHKSTDINNGLKLSGLDYEIRTRQKSIVEQSDNSKQISDSKFELRCNECIGSVFFSEKRGDVRAVQIQHKLDYPLHITEIVRNEA